MVKIRDPLDYLAATFPLGYYRKYDVPLVKQTIEWRMARAAGLKRYDSDPDHIRRIKDTFLQMNPDAEFMKKDWPRFEEMLVNPGLMGLVEFIHGQNSRFLIPMLVSLPEADALEMAFLYGRDINLKFSKMPYNDPYYDIAVRNKLFKYIRMRAAWSGDIIAESQPRKLVFYSCGRLLTTRYICPLTGYQQAICTDTNPTITSKNLFPDENKRSHYTIVNMKDADLVRHPSSFGANFVEYNGQAIYNFTVSDFHDLSMFIFEIVSHMAPGGSFVFDVNCAHREWDKFSILDIPIDATFLKDNSEIEKFFLANILNDLGVSEIITRPIQIDNEDFGVFFRIIK